ncbi:MAG: GAF domain-containing protein [Bellilinea sp.]
MDNLQFPPAFFILLAAGLSTAALLFFVARRRIAPGAKALLLLLAGCTYWSLTYALQNLMRDLTWKTWLDTAVNPGILVVPAAWLIFTLDHTGISRRCNRRNYAWLALEPLLVLGLILTNDRHYLYYASPQRPWTEINGNIYFSLDAGALFWAHTAYSYLLILAGSLVLVSWALRSRGLYRAQVATVIGAALFPWIANLLTLTAPLIDWNLTIDLTPIFFSTSGVLLAAAFFRFRLLNITPLARDLLVELLEDSLFVLDHENRVVDINPAACRLFDVFPQNVIGRPVGELLGPLLPVARQFTHTVETHQVIEIPFNHEMRAFDLRISPVAPPRSTRSGRMVLLREISTVHRAQKALEQSEARYRRLIESSPDAIFVLDARGIILLANPLALDLFALPPAQLETRLGLCSLIAAEQRDEPAFALLTALESGVPQRIEITAVAWDGHRFPAEMSLSAITYPNQPAEEVLCILRDMSVRKRNDENLLRAAENERQNREVADALREIGMALSASLDLDDVLDTMLVQMARVIPYDSGNITLREEGTAVIVRSRGYDQFGEEVTRLIHQFVFDIQHTENFRWMLENRRSMIIQDTHAYPGWVQLEATRYIHCYVGAPIIVNDEVIGFFSLDKKETNYYRPEHARILELFAAQAGQAFHNARLYRESRQLLRRERQLNEIMREFGATLDIEHLLNMVLQRGCGLFEADFGLLGLINAAGDAVEVNYIFHPQRDRFQKVLPKGTGLTWEVIESGRPVLVEDYFNHPKAVQSLREFGVQSLLMAPLQSGGITLGVLAFYQTGNHRSFRESDLPLAVSVGNQAAAAIQNVRLLAESRRRAEEAETLQQASAAVSSALKLEQVLDMVLENLSKVVPYDSCALFLVEDDHLRVVAARGFPHPDQVIGKPFPAHDELLWHSMETKKPIILADAQSDPRFKRWGDAEHVHSWMGVPLIKRDIGIGFLTIDSRKLNLYNENHAKLALGFANQAAAAIENARLFESIQRMAITDPLTGMLNRRHFFELAAREYYRARRYGKMLAVVMIDVDDLKKVNDTYGHLAGDGLILYIGGQCRKQLRKADLAARFGGDEFILLLPETNLEQALQAARRIRESVLGGVSPNPVGINLDRVGVNPDPVEVSPAGAGIVRASISVGVSAIDPTCTSLEMLVNRADQALYTAKQRNKNQVCAWIDGQVRSFTTDQLRVDKE